MNRRDAEAVLANGRWMPHEDPAIMRAVLDASILKRVPAGAIVFDPSGEPSGLIGLAEGRLQLDIMSGGNDSTLFTSATPGFWISDLAVPPGIPRTVTASAATPCSLLILPLDRLRTLGEAVPGVDAAVSRLAAINMWTALHMISVLRRQDRAEMLAGLLVVLAGADLRDGYRLSVPQSDLASMGAVSRTTLVNALRKLERNKFVAVEYGGIRILDAAGLVACMDGACGDPG